MSENDSQYLSLLEDYNILTKELSNTKIHCTLSCTKHILTISLGNLYTPSLESEISTIISKKCLNLNQISITLTPPHNNIIAQVIIN